MSVPGARVFVMKYWSGLGRATCAESTTGDVAELTIDRVDEEGSSMSEVIVDIYQYLLEILSL